jgi:very-short-patch-repair endonuclease
MNQHPAETVSSLNHDTVESVSVAEMVREGVAKAREKLIDLSLRNGMLNYRHSETSSRHVRIVDVKPEQILETLASGAAIDILALPPVEAIPADEDTEAFRDALKTRRTTDPDWLAAEDARRAAGSRRRGKDKVAERKLRDRVREQLGMPEWRAATDPKTRAKELGIDPSYDLTSNHEAPEHDRTNLQTLFFPDRLEPKLSAIHSSARSLQEDAGISALSCAVGFLEWYDADDSPTPAYAPLLLLPVNMQKSVAAGEYVFSISGRDDDETSNVALREKLRQVGIVLPEYDPEGDAEAYFIAVAQAIHNRPRWRIRRWVTIGLFSFARQAMWSDLDPARWPAHAKPEAHRLLQDIYGDAPAGDPNSIAETHDIDHPQVEPMAPALVTDADASQVSAVIDAASGTSLVIQGPPGTGKSQTITNVIAGAMAAGKTVLFVSEKMAALSVVRDRLDQMGLGLFCLEVHSSKASKAQVLLSIKARMEAVRVRSNADEIERARSSLREARQRLTEYARVMNSPAGETGLTTHDVLWGDSSRAELPASIPPGAMAFRFPDPLALDRFKRAELKSAGKALDDHAAAMGEFAEPARQPWRGIGNPNLSRFDRAAAIEVATRWATALGRLLESMQALETRASWDKLTSISDGRAAMQTLRGLYPAGVAVEPGLLPLALEESCVQALTRWSKLALEVRQLDTRVEEACPRASLASVIEKIPRLARQAEALKLAGHPVAEFESLRTAAQTKAGDLSRAADLLRRVFAIAGRDPTREPDVKAEAVATFFLHHVGQFPLKLATFRSPSLAEDGAVDEITQARELAKRAGAAAEQAELAENATAVFASTLPTSQELRDAAATLQTTAFFGRIFGRRWRGAKHTWRRVFPGEAKLPKSAASRLAAAALWKETLTQLEACEGARRTIGRHWKGPATAFDNICETATWMLAVRKVTPPAVEGARELRRLLWEGSTEDIESFAALADEAARLNLMSILQGYYSTQTPIASEAAKAQERSEGLDAMLAHLAELPVRSGVTPKDLEEAAKAYREGTLKRSVMTSETLVTNALGPVSHDEEAARALAIGATLEYARQILGLLPPATARWLLHAENVSRTRELATLADGLVAAMAEEQEARDAAHSLLQFEDESWGGGEFDAVPVQALSNKADRAARAPDDLERQVALLGTEQEAAQLGLNDLIANWSERGLAYRDVARAVEAVFYRSAAETLMRENPVLMRHTGNGHDQVRKRFQELDKEILVLNRKLVAAKLHARTIPIGSRAASSRDYTEAQMLDHQTGLQRPRIALRRLFTNAGNAIRAYKPCILMSPMSVAQYLEPGKHLFDLLIIDEASQMRPEDALGAMMRCAQAVVVGDPEQLPPSDFFRASEIQTDEEVEDTPEESILELGQRCWKPMRMLEVHYRSRHQSLIAYSNTEFYRDRLLVYPSPVRDDPAFGVTCHKVDGIYETGQGRNVPEARAIVEHAAGLMRASVAHSIGIVSVNKAQSELIQSLLDELVASDPAIQAYQERWSETLEPLFVKNLENVQGDERDIILISTVYGKTADGAFHQRFGPINSAFGHRRLNVLFTRAKRRLGLLTSLDPAQIVSDGKARGVRVLKEFLEYAATGRFQSGRRTSEEPDSDFERWFLGRLEQAGYEAHPQVGVAGYRIDIGVVHPDQLGSYILGLECDGAAYHSSKAARDRDRLRQAVLEGLNWRIHRVWSTDWYRDPEREFTRLIQRIETLRASA